MCDWCEKRQATLDAYTAAYPKACKKCGATGWLSYTENQSPFGSGQVWLMEMSDPCSACIENGLCPRCGERIIADDNEFGDEFNKWLEAEHDCPHCGWSHGKAQADYMPVYECDCWMEEE